MPEWRIPFADLGNAQAITAKNVQMFRERGLDVKLNECEIIDDHDRKERVYRVRPRTYIFT